MAARHGKLFTANQIGREKAATASFGVEDGRGRLTLPDFAVWTFPGQHHEIKHKDRAKYGNRTGCYGLERYRFDYLIEFQDKCKQAVYYTIHDHEKAGGKYAKQNKIEDWVTANISLLDGAWTCAEMGKTWCNGVETTKEILYWDYTLFSPLEPVLSGNPMDMVLKTNPLLTEIEKLRNEVARFRRMANDAAAQSGRGPPMRRRQENTSLFLPL